MIADEGDKSLPVQILEYRWYNQHIRAYHVLCDLGFGFQLLPGVALRPAWPETYVSMCFETLAACVDVLHVLAPQARLKHGPEFELDFQVLLQAMLIEDTPKDSGGHGRKETWHVFVRVPFASARHVEILQHRILIVYMSNDFCWLSALTH